MWRAQQDAIKCILSWEEALSNGATKLGEGNLIVLQGVPSAMAEAKTLGIVSEDGV